MASTVPDLEISHEKFIDKTSIIYGESGTGKSVIIVDILHALRPFVEQIVVISPTDRQNHTYDKGIVPLLFIHYTITTKLLEDLWKRQEALAAVFTRSNNKKTLESLFGKIPANARSEADDVIEGIKRKLRDSESEINKSTTDDSVAKSKIGEMKEECDKLIVKIYKHSITKNGAQLARLKLSDDEQYSLKYHGMNPRLVVIFDDATDLIKKYKTHPVMQKIFYQGRHSMITALIACHTDKALDSELKKNAAVSIFTEFSCASSYFTRTAMSFDRETQTKAIAAAKIAFSPTTPHQKLAWVRHEKKYYKFCAERRNGFGFCSAIVREYARLAACESGKVSADNQFMSDFM